MIEVVRGSGIAIQQEHGFSPPKAGYRAHGLDIGGRLLWRAEIVLVIYGLRLIR